MQRLALVSALLWALASARDVKFNISSANSCDDMLVQISAGNYVYPLVLTVTPFELAPLNITINQDPNLPTTAARNVTVPQLPWEAGRQIIVSLSDQTGFASCGTSNAMTLGSSQTGNNCNTTIKLPDFFFSLDSPLIQCGQYPFTKFTNATQPVKIFFQIPLGDSFAIQAPVSSVFTYTWLANEKANTPIVFTMVDALGKQGGSSDARVVGQSSNSACLHGGSNGLSSGVIAGIVVTVVVLMFGALFLYMFLRKRKRDYAYDVVDLDANHFSEQFVSNNLPENYQATPFIVPSEPPSPPPRASKRVSNSTLQPPPSASSSSSHTPPATPNRLIVHRDITEEEGEEEGQVVELPPTYSARRAPIPGITPPAPVASEEGPPLPEKSAARRQPR